MFEQPKIMILQRAIQFGSRDHSIQLFYYACYNNKGNNNNIVGRVISFLRLNFLETNGPMSRSDDAGLLHGRDDVSVYDEN